MKKMQARRMFGYDRKLVAQVTALKCEDPSLAKQEYKEECDINTIAQNFGIGSQLPEGVRMPSYGDFSDVRDFKSAMDAIAKSREAFDAMPATVRARFQNDPHQFVAFCSDKSNLQEAISLGLVPPPKVAPVAATAPISNPQGINPTTTTTTQS